MKKKRIRNICLSLFALGTILTAGVSNALAYFTTYTTAEGGLPIHLGDRTEITESFDARTKHLTITSDPDSEPLYIRARAFCARYELTYQGDAWTQEAGEWNRIVPAGEPDEYWYYRDIIKGGESTETLDVIINIPAQSQETTPDPTKPEQPQPEDGETFNVIVIYESTPVRYDENGEPYADWTGTLDIVTDTGTGNGTGGDTNVEE